MILINCFDFQIAGYDICESDIPYFIRPGSTIMSPNYPNNYEASSDCTMTIRFSADQKVLLTVEAFDVEYQSTCSYDYLSVHDGFGYNEPMIGSKLCGSSLSGTTLQSTGNTMTLYFHTDDGQTRNGFKLHAYSGKIHDIITNCFNIFSKS